MSDLNAVLTERPWLKGIHELIECAVDHYKKGKASDMRFAMIHIDNSVELAGRLYLKMEARLQDTLPPNEMKEVERYFDKLLKQLSRHLALDNITRSNIEYFHSLRNSLYHDGNGISVNPEIVAAYLTIAISLLEQMYGLSIPFDGTIRESDLADLISRSAKKVATEVPNNADSSPVQKSFYAQIYKKFEDILAKRYETDGYLVEKSPTLLVDGRSIKPDMICHRTDIVLIIEIRYMIPVVNLDVIEELHRRKLLIDRALSKITRTPKIFRMHVNEGITHSTKISEWEVEDWVTTIDIMKQLGHTEIIKNFVSSTGECFVPLSLRSIMP